MKTRSQITSFKPEISPDTRVVDVLDWPSTVDVFFSHKLDCVGCLMSPFCTLEEVSRVYKLPLEILIGAFRDSIT